MATAACVRPMVELLVMEDARASCMIARLLTIAVGLLWIRQYQTRERAMDRIDRWGMTWRRSATPSPA
jgi:hypothetical protein